MIHQVCPNPELLQQLYTGPLGAHVDTFAQHLLGQGYASSTAKYAMRVAAFSTWLSDKTSRQQTSTNNKLRTFCTTTHGGVVPVVVTAPSWDNGSRSCAIAGSFPYRLSKPITARVSASRVTCSTTCSTSVAWCPRRCHPPRRGTAVFSTTGLALTPYGFRPWHPDSTDFMVRQHRQ